MTLSARAAVVDAEGRFLLRLDDSGRWAFPGGFVCKGEAAEEALKRILATEVQVDEAVAAELFGIYATLPDDPLQHVALFIIRQNRTDPAGDTYFPPGALPDPICTSCRQRIREISGAIPQSETW